MGTSEAAAAAVIGVDLGTTAVKVQALAVGDRVAGGRLLASASREYPLQQPRPGWEVQDAERMMQATLEALAECSRGIGPTPVVGLGLSTAMHGLLGLDADRRPITPLVTWADTRAATEAQVLRASGVASAARSGTPVHAMAPIAKIRWFCDNDAATASAVRWWVGLKDLLVLTLTGQLVTERSSASGTGLLCLATGDWDADLVELSGARLDQLPPVMSTTAHLPLAPDAAAATGLAPGTPVVLGAGDGPLGNLGVGALDPGVAGLSLGTSGAIRMLVDAPPAHNDGSLFCYALTDQAWVVGGAISNGGMVARWAGERYLHDTDPATRDAALIDLAATAPPGCDGLVMIPYLVGERAPLWDPAIPGALLGVRREHTTAHMARAAIEGVALQLSLVLGRVQSVHPVDQVRATGGVFRATLWRDVVCAALERPLLVTDAAGGSGTGAAALALLALGAADTLHAALALLGADSSSGTPVQPDAALVAAARRSRASVRPLLEGLAPLGAMMTHPG